MEEDIDNFLDEIVLKVKEERVKRNISQLALAQILGHKSPNYIAKIETRKHNPGLDPERAGVIVGGLCIIVAIMRHFELAQITISCCDLLDGLYLSMCSL